MQADFGCRSAVETRLAELFPSLEGIRLAQRKLAGWMRVQRRGLSFWFWPAKARVQPQPLGVAGIIVPWNYPVFLALGPLTSALAAGNRAMVKMSELSPHSGALLQKLCRQYLGDDVVQVVNGDVSVAQAFAALPFDHFAVYRLYAGWPQCNAGCCGQPYPGYAGTGGQIPRADCTRFRYAPRGGVAWWRARC